MAPILSILVLAQGLLKVIPDDIKRKSLGVLIDKGETAFVEYICDNAVVKRTGLGHNVCHKVAELIANEFRKEVGIKRR